MEKSEPTLVPEWLRSGFGGSGSGHLFASSSSHTDSSSLTRGRNRSSKGLNSSESVRPSFLDRSSSSNSRRNYANGSAKNAYSSFSRNNRDKDREREKDRLNFSSDYWDHVSFDPLGSGSSRIERDPMRRSHSMVTRKPDDLVNRKGVSELNSVAGNNHANENGVMPKVELEKDFPSLMSDDSKNPPDVVQVASPVLFGTAQSLPVGSSSLLSGEGWNSALVDVPNNLSTSFSVSASASQSSSSSALHSSNGIAGLNMAEALTQVAARNRTCPQPSVQTQRREELAIKQSRQLIPVTPCMPKMSILTPDKSKSKPLVRSGEVTLSSKTTHQGSSSAHLTNQSAPGGTKADVSKSSHGKLFVLKPGWDNGASQPPKDAGQPSTSAAANSSKTSNNPKVPHGDRKTSASSWMPGFSFDKKPSLSQTQSRNDFFNHLKMKNTSSASSSQPESVPAAVSTSCEYLQKDAASLKAPKGGADSTENGGSRDDVLCFSEEETAFLRSLGWEENSGEEGLTEEEINSFYEYMNRKLSKQTSSCQEKMMESNHAKSSNGVPS